MLKISFICAAVLWLAANGPVGAAYVLTYDVQSFSGQPPVARPCTTKIYVEHDRLRSETLCAKIRGAKAFTMITIYRADLGLLWSINPKTDRYSEVTEEQMAAEGAKQEEAYRHMSPEQRDVMARKGYEIDGLDIRPAYRYEKTFRLEKIKHWKCWGYTLYRCLDKQSDLCVADGNGILPGLGDPNLRKLLEKAFAAQLSTEQKAMEKARTRDLKPTSFLLRNATMMNGNPITTMELVDVSHAPTRPSQFELPGGLEKTSNPFFVGLQ